MQDTLYTEDEFLAARMVAISELGYDPCDDSESFTTGWRSDGYHRRRWWYGFPWRYTRPWLPRTGRGADEYCNPTFYAVTPLGGVTIRYKRGKLRGWTEGVCQRCIEEAGCPPCPLDHFLHWPPCLPVKVTCPECQRVFGSEGDTGRFKPDGGPLCCSAQCAGRT